MGVYLAGATMSNKPYAAVNLFLLAMLVTYCCNTKADIYIKIGSGYKVFEPTYVTCESGERINFDNGGKISARIEIGKEVGNWTYGISHHSQWEAGFPFNDRNEPHKTEIFIDYRWTL